MHSSRVGEECEKGYKPEPHLRDRSLDVVVLRLVKMLWVDKVTVLSER